METQNDGQNVEISPVFDVENARRKVAYHEAAHAALFWNLGFPVTSITVNRIRFCGRVCSTGHPRDRHQRVARAVAGVAGLASQALLAEVTWEDVGRSTGDLQRACALYSMRDGLTEGEQLGIGIALAQKAVRLIKEPPVRKQIESLSKPLLRDGRMFQPQIHARLERHPASLAAKRLCREFVREIDAQHDAILERAAGYAPGVRWPAELP